jgi:hypothetical protein
MKPITQSLFWIRRFREESDRFLRKTIWHNSLQFSVNKKLLALFLSLCFCFTYFSQGGGHNQNATYGEIRGIVEHGTFDMTLTGYQEITSDVAKYNGRIFSNKSPNIIFFTAPAYWMFYNSAKSLGIDTKGKVFQLAGIHTINFFSAGVWGALLSLVLFFVLKELYPRLRAEDRLWLSGAFCLGSLVFPYATVAFSHAFEVFWVMYVFWRSLVWNREPTKTRTVLLGVGFGGAMLANPLTILLTPAIYLNVLLASKRKVLDLVLLSIVVVLVMSPLLSYNYYNFGSIMEGNRTHMSDVYLDQDLFMGVFSAPHFERLKRIFIWGHRSIIPSMAYLWFCVPAIFYIYKFKKITLPRFSGWIPLSAFIIYTTFMLSFNGWHGGSCFGPRYMMPLILFMAVFSVPFYWLQKTLYRALLSFSVFVMFMATAIDMMPANIHQSPLKDIIFRGFKNGNYPMGGYPSFPGMEGLNFKYNFGQLLGLNGHLSVLPLFVVGLFSYIFIIRTKTTSNTEKRQVHE